MAHQNESGDCENVPRFEPVLVTVLAFLFAQFKEFSYICRNIYVSDGKFFCRNQKFPYPSANKIRMVDHSKCPAHKPIES